MRSTFFYLLLLLGAPAACTVNHHASSAGSEKAPAAADQAANGPVLVFGKTPCFGKCPHFEASIYADGRVKYVGHSNVTNIGTFGCPPTW